MNTSGISPSNPMPRQIGVRRRRTRMWFFQVILHNHAKGMKSVISLFQRYQQQRYVSTRIKWIKRSSNQLTTRYLSEWKATFSSLPSRLLPSSSDGQQLSYCRPGFSPTVVSRQIFRRLLYKIDKNYESVVLVQGAPCPRVTLQQIWERSVVAKRREQAKTWTSRSERPPRHHLDDGSFARLPPVHVTPFTNMVQLKSQHG